MPLMQSWTDYVPDVLQVRGVVAQATARTRLAAAALAAATDRECGEALVDATAEAYRVIVLAGPSHSEERLFAAAFDRARLNIERDPSRRAIAGVIAYANLALSRGGYIEGHYDRTTRQGLASEVAWLELARRLPTSGPDVDRLLGFAALAAGGPGLAHRLSADDALARLCDALDAPPEGARRAFIRFVEEFPHASHGYAELGFVARAYVVHVERRGPGGIGAAIQWLRQTIHEGPPALPSPEPAQALPHPPAEEEVPAPNPTIDERLAARAGPLLAPADRRPGRRLSFTSLGFSNMHGLHGGHAITIEGDGAVAAELAHGPYTWRYRASLSDAGVAEMEALVARHPIRAIERSSRMGIPGETFVSLSIADEHGEHSTGRWWGDSLPHDFQNVTGLLEQLARAVCASTPGEHVPRGGPPARYPFG